MIDWYISIVYLPHQLGEYDISKLSKHVEKEIEHQRRFIRDEGLTIERVTEDFAKLIRDNNISVGVLPFDLSINRIM